MLALYLLTISEVARRHQGPHRSQFEHRTGTTSKKYRSTRLVAWAEPTNSLAMNSLPSWMNSKVRLAHEWTSGNDWYYSWAICHLCRQSGHALSAWVDLDIADRRCSARNWAHTPSRSHPEYWNGGQIYWIGIKDARLHHGRTIRETIQKVTQLGIENSAARLLLPAGPYVFLERRLSAMSLSWDKKWRLESGFQNLLRQIIAHASCMKDT